MYATTSATANRIVTLNTVRGDSAEFADLIGRTGLLMPRPGGYSFLPGGCGDIITLTVDRYLPLAKPGWLAFRTIYGNTFVFRP